MLSRDVLRESPKCVCGRACAPDPVGGAYNAPLEPLAGFGGGKKWGSERDKKEGGKDRGGKAGRMVRLGGECFLALRENGRPWH